MVVDLLFLLATAACGWGLSLVTYRIFASRQGWPMGEWQLNKPVLPISIGLVVLIIAFLFAAYRGSQYGGWMILVLGALFAIFWTGFLRVASQTSLFLAPTAAFLLMVCAGLGLSTLADIKQEVRSVLPERLLSRDGVIETRRFNPLQPEAKP